MTPRPTLPIVAIAASSGGFLPLRAFVSRLPADFPAAVLIVSHVAQGRTSRLPTLLSAAGVLPVFHATDGERLEAGRILVAPSGHHLSVRNGVLHLTSGARENRVRPAADVLFRSVARAAGPLASAIVLSGTGSDGSQGLLAVRAAGGMTVVQDPADAEFPAMPQHALAAAGADARLPSSAIAAFVDRMVRDRIGETARRPARRRPRTPRQPQAANVVRKQLTRSSALREPEAPAESAWAANTIRAVALARQALARSRQVIAQSVRRTRASRRALRRWAKSGHAPRPRQ